MTHSDRIVLNNAELYAPWLPHTPPLAHLRSRKDSVGGNKDEALSSVSISLSVRVSVSIKIKMKMDKIPQDVRNMHGVERGLLCRSTCTMLCSLTIPSQRTRAASQVAPDRAASGKE